MRADRNTFGVAIGNSWALVVDQIGSEADDACSRPIPIPSRLEGAAAFVGVQAKKLSAGEDRSSVRVADTRMRCKRCDSRQATYAQQQLQGSVLGEPTLFFGRPR